MLNDKRTWSPAPHKVLFLPSFPTLMVVSLFFQWTKLKACLGFCDFPLPWALRPHLLPAVNSLLGTASQVNPPLSSPSTTSLFQITIHITAVSVSLISLSTFAKNQMGTPLGSLFCPCANPTRSWLLWLLSLETLGDWLLLLSSFSKLFSEVWAWDISVWISLGLSCSELTKLLNWRLVSHPNPGEFSAISLLRTFSVLPSFPSTGISKTQMSGPLRICSFSLPLVYFLSVIQIGECLWLCLQIHWFFPLSSPFCCIAHPVWFCFGYCLLPF